MNKKDNKKEKGNKNTYKRDKEWISIRQLLIKNQ